ncbi:MAG: hypothetical protein BIFFINMI_01843 [Phycisphaerae bacterium]|nr:hypothetical protein [Phycisphaerae bacterium]
MHAVRILFEDAGFRNLLPLVWWRSVGELRCGRRRLLRKHFAAPAEPGGPEPVYLWVRDMLADVVAERNSDAHVNVPVPASAASVLLVNARYLFGGDIASRPAVAGPPAVGVCGGQVAWLRLSAQSARALDPDMLLAGDAPDAEAWASRIGRREEAPGSMIDYPWDIVRHNHEQMMLDWNAAIAAGGRPAIEGRVYDGAYLLEPGSIHVGKGSVVKPCTVLDAEKGPIWIGDGVTISPNCTIQGPVAICHGTLIQPGACIHEGTTIGPVCKVGGEVEESVIWGYSNKQHDGFLGHAVLGAWINIAADSINSDLKNTYGPVRVPINGVEVDSGQKFVGLTMGDHSKSSINASFSTGSVVGFCANVVCNAFPPKFVPSFCWLTDTERRAYDVEKGLEVARTVMARRKVTLTAAEERLFHAIAAECRNVEAAAAFDPPEA